MPRAAPHPVDRAAQVTPVDLDPDRVVTVPAGPVPADRVVQADLGCTGPADLAGLVAPAPGCTGPADLAVPAARGMATTSAATSTAPRGVMDPHPGDRAHHRGRHWNRPLPPPGGQWGYGPINYWGYQENPMWNPAVQPVGLQLLRSLDPAVTTHLTRRPLRQSAKRAL